MINVELFKTKCSQANAEKKPAYTKIGSVYDKGELSFRVNVMTGKNFRLVHNGKSVLALVEGSTKHQTVTIYNTEECATRLEATERIKALGLIFVEPEEEKGKL